MGSSGKRKTTMAKLNRERKLQERRRDKAARKDARRSSPDPSHWGAALTAELEDAEGVEDQPDAPEGAEEQDQPAAPEGVGTHEAGLAPPPSPSRSAQTTAGLQRAPGGRS